MKHAEPLAAYLEPSRYIDFEEAGIQAVVHELMGENRTEIGRIRSAFEYVRDQISHSWDIRAREVSRTASEVLARRHGICYAKSHLLAALLRGMEIPAGIAYQRLTLYDKPEDGYCIHALNTVYWRDGNQWIRLDARGNKAGVDAQFSVEEEKLAFAIRTEYGEWDYPDNYPQPHAIIIKTLEEHEDCLVMCERGLPEELRS